MNWTAGIRGAISGFTVAFAADYANYKNAPAESKFDWGKAFFMWFGGALLGFASGLVAGEVVPSGVGQ